MAVDIHVELGAKICAVTIQKALYINETFDLGISHHSTDDAILQVATS